MRVSSPPASSTSAGRAVDAVRRRALLLEHEVDLFDHDLVGQLGQLREDRLGLVTRLAPESSG